MGLHVHDAVRISLPTLIAKWRWSAKLAVIISHEPVLGIDLLASLVAVRPPVEADGVALLHRGDLAKLLVLLHVREWLLNNKGVANREVLVEWLQFRDALEPTFSRHVWAVAHHRDTERVFHFSSSCVSSSSPRYLIRSASIILNVRGTVPLIA